MTVPAVHRWPSNADLIFDVVDLGYIHGHVVDLTYGQGTFWKKFSPASLTGVDIRPEHCPWTAYRCGVDGTNTRFESKSFDTVVIDPPYKLNGTPDGAVDGRYGAHEVSTIDDRHELMRLLLIEGVRLLAPRGHLLFKCMDQVSSGKFWPQTSFVTESALRNRLEPVDRFDFIGHARPQKMEGRTQKHAHGRGSTLLVFKKGSS